MVYLCKNAKLSFLSFFLLLLPLKHLSSEEAKRNFSLNSMDALQIFQRQLFFFSLSFFFCCKWWWCLVLLMAYYKLVRSIEKFRSNFVKLDFVAWVGKHLWGYVKLHRTWEFYEISVCQSLIKINTNNPWKAWKHNFKPMSLRAI